MKKSTIGVIIAAVILIIIGGGLFVGGIVAAGGVSAAQKLLNGSAIDGIFDLHWDDDEFYIGKKGMDFEFSNKNHQKISVENNHEKVNQAEAHPEEETVGETNVFSDMEPVVFAMDEIEKLYLEVREAEVEIGGNSNREISVRTDGDYEIYVRNKVLCIKPKGDQKEHKMLIELPNVLTPEEMQLKEAEIHAGASNIDISRISSKEFDLEVGAGQVTINHLTAEQADFEIGAGEVIVEYGNVNDCETNVDLGNFEYTGMILKHGDVECNMGNAAYHLEKGVEDYNFEISCGAGNVDIGSESFSGLGREKYIDNHVQESFDIECNMGNVSIDSIN